jgi:hypothetical protein
MRKERADLQMMHGQLRTQSEQVNGNLVKCLDEIAKIKIWCSKAREIFQLQNVIQRQDEVDKQSITLIGTREVPVNHGKSTMSSLDSPKQGKQRETPLLSIDTNCVNCHNNPNASDRQLILQNFKRACL